MRNLTQTGIAFILCGLPVLLGIFHLAAQWPADNYIDAMAKGQYGKARQFLHSETQAGNPASQTSLANLYYLGLGGDTDYALAAELYHKAASNGHAAAQLNLGHLYRQGFGVQKSAERAYGWYVHANIASDPWAEYYLSQISVELTLTPLQMSVLNERWLKLDALAGEPL